MFSCAPCALGDLLDLLSSHLHWALEERRAWHRQCRYPLSIRPVPPVRSRSWQECFWMSFLSWYFDVLCTSLHFEQAIATKAKFAMAVVMAKDLCGLKAAISTFHKPQLECGLKRSEPPQKRLLTHDLSC